jgi:hypothetical protein
MYVNQHYLNVAALIFWIFALMYFATIKLQTFRRIIAKPLACVSLLCAMTFSSSPAHAATHKFTESVDVDPWSGEPTASTQTSPLVQSPAIQPLTTHVVEPGDNLFKIAAEISDDIVPLWCKMIAENVEHLRSKNPNLIYPGEEITIPT